MSNCNSCHKNPCGCNECRPAQYGCDVSVQVDPYDSSTWLFNLCGALHRVKMPKNPETCTDISTDFSAKNLIYNGECGQSIISGRQLGEIIELNGLRDVDVTDADPCDIMVYDPGCTSCGEGCKPKPAMWRKYHIPDAGDCEVELGDDGYYRVLIKDDCGCIKECRLPAMPDGSAVIDYVRDSVPDDSDFPWYYGCYNDTIHLYLAQNAAQWFGKYDLEVTVNYGVQSIKSHLCKNVNWRSIIVPVVEGTSINVTRMASILQDDCSTRDNDNEVMIPWGTKSLRSSFTFIVPKGKDAYLHHEFRYRSKDSFPDYYTNATYDGKIVPDEYISQVDSVPHNASRLNALQVIVKPARGISDMDPVKDAERTQLDAPVDEYVNVG